MTLSPDIEFARHRYVSLCARKKQVNSVTDPKLVIRILHRKKCLTRIMTGTKIKYCKEYGILYGRSPW